MSLLRSAPPIARPMVTRTGVLMLPSPGNVAAPPIVRPPSDFNFDLGTNPAVKGWPATNNQFANFGADRDWTYNFRDPNESFSGIRWQPTWFDVIGWNAAGWEPAGGEVYRLYRKGDSGQAAHTIVLECEANTAAVPVGDPVVVFQKWNDGDWNMGTLDLNGYKLPLRTKMTCVGGWGEWWNDGRGRRVIELDAGQELPWFDHYPGFYESQYARRSQVQCRHWSFFKGRNNKELRHPLGWFTDISKNQVLANGGYLMLGGMQAVPTWWDYSWEWNRMGASLVEELWRLECEGLAEYFGDTDPRRCAVEFENEPTIRYTDGWEDEQNQSGQWLIGYGRLLREVWYPIARRAYGPDRTLVLKSTVWGGLNSLIDEFDFPCPPGDNAHLVHHNYPGQIRSPMGLLDWSNISHSEWAADQVRAKISSLGYLGGGATELAGDYNGESWRVGQQIGRQLTSYTRRDLYCFFWSMVGDGYRSSEVQNINGRSIEAFRRDIAPYARRAEIMTV